MACPALPFPALPCRAPRCPALPDERRADEARPNDSNRHLHHVRHAAVSTCQHGRRGSTPHDWDGRLPSGLPRSVATHSAPHFRRGGCRVWTEEQFCTGRTPSAIAASFARPGARRRLDTTCSDSECLR
eukprot:365644-Chlamydomonas_euryale.AAC.1